MRCKRAGSRSEISLILELNERAVLLKGWNAVVSAPSSGAPMLTEPVAPTNTVMGLTDWLIGAMKLIWLEVALGCARMARRVSALNATPTAVGGIGWDRKGPPDLARQQ